MKTSTNITKSGIVLFTRSNMLEVLPSSHFVRSQCTERDCPKFFAVEDGPFSSCLTVFVV